MRDTFSKRADELLRVAREIAPSVEVRSSVVRGDSERVQILEVVGAGADLVCRRSISDALVRYCFARDWACGFTVQPATRQAIDLAIPIVYGATSVGIGAPSTWGVGAGYSIASTRGFAELVDSVTDLLRTEQDQAPHWLDTVAWGGLNIYDDAPFHVSACDGPSDFDALAA